MSKQGFYNDNLFRAYPFKDPDIGLQLPESTLVDFNCYIYIDVGYAEDQNKVWLYSVERVGNDFAFKFACDADGLTGNYLTFVKNLSDPEFSYAFSSNIESYTSSSIVLDETLNESYAPNTCPEKILWEGYIVIGSLAELADTMNPGDIIYDYSGDTVVEPALVINIQDSTVRTLNIANRLPAQVTPPDGCEGPPVLDEILVHRTCITGDVVFSHGYCCDVGMTVADNEINFTALETGSIKGNFCGNEQDTAIYIKSLLVPGIQVASTHVVPANSALYSGGPTCRETLKSINGISAKRLWIVGGKGISLTTDQETFSINVEVTLSGLAICANSSLYLSSASLG